MSRNDSFLLKRYDIYISICTGTNRLQNITHETHDFFLANYENAIDSAHHQRAVSLHSLPLVEWMRFWTGTRMQAQIWYRVLTYYPHPRWDVFSNYSNQINTVSLIWSLTLTAQHGSRSFTSQSNSGEIKSITSVSWFPSICVTLHPPLHQAPWGKDSIHRTSSWGNRHQAN